MPRTDLFEIERPRLRGLATRVLADRGGDTSHEEAHNEVKGRWRRPKKSLGWYFATKKTFAELLED